MRRDQQAITAGISGLTGTPAESGSLAGQVPFGSPWATTGNLERIIWGDIFGDVPPPNSRAAAMRIPTIKRGRGLIVNAVSKYVLKVADENGVLEPKDQPTWLYRTNIMGVAQRNVWTVDDLIFSGASLWEKTIGSDKFPLTGVRVNMGRWSINADMHVEIDGIVVPDESVIIIPGFDEGIIALGSDAITDIRALYEIVRDRLKNPVAVTELHQTGGAPMTKPEIDDMLAEHRASRRLAGGAVSYTSENIQGIYHGDQADQQFLIEARNAAAVDAARLLGISAGMVDATAPKASLNYETQTGRNQEFQDLDVSYYMTPITDRLSMDDCVPAGKRVVFDTAVDLAEPSPIGPVRQD